MYSVHTIVFVVVVVALLSSAMPFFFRLCHDLSFLSLYMYIFIYDIATHEQFLALASEQADIYSL